MQVLNRLGDLKEYPLAFVLGQAALGLHVRAQIASVEAFHNEMHAFGSLHGLVHTGNARVGDLLHDFDLCVDALPVRGILQFALVVGLDRHLGARESVPGSANFAVTTNTNHFPDHVHIHHSTAGGYNATTRARREG